MNTVGLTVGSVSVQVQNEATRAPLDGEQRASERQFIYEKLLEAGLVDAAEFVKHL